MATPGLVGIWLDGDGLLHGVRRAPDGGLSEFTEAFAPYAWSPGGVPPDFVDVRRLQGAGSFPERWHFPDLERFQEAVRLRELGLDVIRPLEQQWLLAREERLYGDMTFAQLRRCQLVVAVASAEAGTTPDPGRPGDRVLAIGLKSSHQDALRLLLLEEDSDKAERVLLKRFGEVLAELDPDVVEGHRLYNFALDYLARRCRRYRVARTWGRFGGEIKLRKARLRVAERWLDYMRCDLPGRAIFDSWLAVQLFDVSTRDMPAYDLKEAAVYFGITDEAQMRPELTPEEARTLFEHDRTALAARLEKELREGAGIADQLLPTYVAQAQNFPMLLQEACLRGTGAKVDLLLLERYYHADHALPAGSDVASFAGAFTKSYGEGVFRHVLHFDVASLYPSLLLQIGRNPANDTLGAFIPLLENLRRYRLLYKQKAREETDPVRQQEFAARQASFKILINSFYGYLGFGGARFADGELAAEVTRRGRELLQQLVEWFEQQAIPVLEADTDGIYVSARDYYDRPEALLAEVREILPEGIDLEYDGRYPGMFCYKAKNYALFDGETVTIRGSALRSRGIEPFLKELTDHLIHYLLGEEESSPEVLLHRLAAQIEEGTLPVERLAKSEYLSMSPAAYAAKLEKGGKPRRAALEVALRAVPAPRMGERVSYYIRPKTKGQTADWQRAEPLERFDPSERPYDPKYYIKKLNDWHKRYGHFYD